MNEEKSNPLFDLDKAKRYAKTRLILSLASTLLSLIILMVLVGSSVSHQWANGAKALSNSRIMQTTLYFSFFSLTFLILEWPLHFYSSFVLEHRYQLSNQTLSKWFLEDAKRQALSFLVALGLVLALYAVIHQTGRLWWLWAWVGWVFFSIVMSELLPVLVIPLFYKYQSIENPKLKEHMIRLVEPYKLKIKNIYSLNLSKNTKKTNAMFCGLGHTKRVVLADTLVQQFSEDEIDSVVAHEVGHFHYHHLWKGIAFSSLSSFLIFKLADLLFRNFQNVLHISDLSDVAGFPFLCLIFFSFLTLISPLQNWFSRRMERQADAFSLQITQNKNAFIQTMKKLSQTNLSDPSPHPIVEFLFYSHPSIQKRIAFAQGKMR